MIVVEACAVLMAVAFVVALWFLVTDRTPREMLRAFRSRHETRLVFVDSLSQADVDYTQSEVERFLSDL